VVVSGIVFFVSDDFLVVLKVIQKAANGALTRIIEKNIQKTKLRHPLNSNKAMIFGKRP
jgi:hypothetical protein